MTNYIKVINNRTYKRKSKLFHYAHFICDCLFPEIINGLYKYNVVFRIKTLDQTIGNLSNIYEDVMQNKNIEELTGNFSKIPCKRIVLHPRSYYIHNIKHVNKFRWYIFNRYKIRPLVYDNNYSEVLLIKRGERIQLIDDSMQYNSKNFITTGRERREINDIDILEQKLREIYTDNFKAVFLEKMPFKEQVKLFNNAKVIILAHGAAMSNMFFCKKGTTIIEVTCDKKWPFFDEMSSILKLNHIKVDTNNVEAVINSLPAQ
jgi:hypothetical protein